MFKVDGTTIGDNVAQLTNQKLTIKLLGNLNGTQRVYGIPQGKSEWLRTANPLQQVDWGLRYIGHKYGYVRTIEGMQPNTCKALDHWKRKGWH